MGEEEQLITFIVQHVGPGGGTNTHKVSMESDTQVGTTAGQHEARRQRRNPSWKWKGILLPYLEGLWLH